MSEKSSLILRKETLPVRCEICHQTDLFNPETGVCRRCENVSQVSPHPAVVQLAEEITFQRRIRWLRFLTLGSGILGGVLGLIGTGYCMFPDPNRVTRPGIHVPVDPIIGFYFLIGAALVLFFTLILGVQWVGERHQNTNRKRHIIQLEHNRK